MNKIVEKLAALNYKALDALRSREAFTVAGRPPTGKDFAGFGHARQCLLVTFKRSGDPVPSPVNFGRGDDGKLYLRTDGTTAKVRRMRRDPHVVVVPCNLRGKPLGPAVDAAARIQTDADEAAHAEAVVAANWTRGMRVLERILDKAAPRVGLPIIYVELTPGAPG